MGSIPSIMAFHPNGTDTDEVFTITNLGDSPALINSITIVGIGPFTVQTEDCSANSPIDPAETCDVTIRFSPTLTGNYTGDLFRISHDDGTLSSPVNLDFGIEGNSAIPASLTISEIVIGDANFGDVVHTGTLTRRFNVTNSGQVDATLVVEGGLGAPYSFAGGFPGGIGGSFCPNTGTISPGTCEIEVTFNPTDVGLGPVVYPDTISISYFDGSTAAGPATLALTGRGLDKATLAITPNPHNYNNVAVGGLSVQTFTVTNSGDVQASNVADAGMTLPFELHLGQWILSWPRSRHSLWTQHRMASVAQILANSMWPLIPKLPWISIKMAPSTLLTMMV